jgi:hypothetical protein
MSLVPVVLNESANNRDFQEFLRTQRELEQKLNRLEDEVRLNSEFKKRLNRSLQYMATEMSIQALNYTSLLTPGSIEVLSLVRIFPTYFICKSIVKKLEANFLQCETVFHKILCDIFRQLTIFLMVYYLFFIGKSTVLVGIETFLQVWNSLSTTQSIILERFKGLLAKLSTKVKFLPITTQLNKGMEIWDVVKNLVKEGLKQAQDFSRFQKLISLGSVVEYNKVIKYLDKKIELALEEGEEKDAESYEKEKDFLQTNLKIIDDAVYPVDDKYTAALDYFNLIDKVSLEEFDNAMFDLLSIDDKYVASYIEDTGKSLIPQGIEFDEEKNKLLPDLTVSKFEKLVQPVKNLLTLEKYNVALIKKEKPVENMILDYYENFQGYTNTFKAPLLNDFINDEYTREFVEKVADDIQDIQVDLAKEINRGIEKLATVFASTLSFKMISEETLKTLPQSVQTAERMLTYVPDAATIKSIVTETNETVNIGFSVINILLLSVVFVFIISIFMKRTSRYFKKDTTISLKSLEQIPKEPVALKAIGQIPRRPISKRYPADYDWEEGEIPSDTE